MGVFVSVVQALVFTLLSAVYISMAVAHEEH
jgi:F0F1-type ATP synthase membrane subunit a